MVVSVDSVIVNPGPVVVLSLDSVVVNPGPVVVV